MDGFLSNNSTGPYPTFRRGGLRTADEPLLLHEALLGDMLADRD